ncbi:hypothetical protein V1478_014093 [Vespula squamosa]|uniref:Uncharacterized protein n=1 Tax=Vespula squamosa TaxID=30214 RepID=A0ABD2A706_VESSQ
MKYSYKGNVRKFRRKKRLIRDEKERHVDGTVADEKGDGGGSDGSSDDASSSGRSRSSSSSSSSGSSD